MGSVGSSDSKVSLDRSLALARFPSLPDVESDSKVSLDRSLELARFPSLPSVVSESNSDAPCAAASAECAEGLELAAATKQVVAAAVPRVIKLVSGAYGPRRRQDVDVDDVVTP